MIRLEDVWLGFGGQAVLRGMSLNAPAKKVTALVGPSGSGKSTVLKLIMGFLKPERGRILIDGEDVGGLGERAWRGVRRKMGMVFQNSALFDSLSVMQNVGFYPRYVDKMPWRKLRPLVMDMLGEVGLAGDAAKLPGELSGGMKRRVALARSLIYKPKILLYDEPTSGLDPHLTQVVVDLINEMNEKIRCDYQVISLRRPIGHDVSFNKTAQRAYAPCLFKGYR
ncbi:ATP-binding cassette domain-containing protein [bacterium]|nr:ATP-binding cassette domain-containing protein [bacterium]